MANPIPEIYIVAQSSPWKEVDDASDNGFFDREGYYVNEDPHLGVRNRTMSWRSPGPIDSARFSIHFDDFPQQYSLIKLKWIDHNLFNLVLAHYNPMRS